MAESSNNRPSKKSSKKASKKAASKKTVSKKSSSRKQASPARSEMEELLAALNSSAAPKGKRTASLAPPPSLKSKLFPEGADVMTYVIAAVAAVISVAALFLVVSRSGSSRADACKDSLAAIQEMSSAPAADQAAFGQSVAKAEANCTYREYNSFTSSLMSASTTPVTTAPTSAPSSSSPQSSAPASSAPQSSAPASSAPQSSAPPTSNP